MIRIDYKMKFTRNNRSSKNESSLIDEPTLVLIMLFIIISIWPGIIIASFLNFVFDLNVLYIWLITIISTILIGALFYYITPQKDLRFYFLASILFFIMIVVYTLFCSNNFIFHTFKKMIPFIFN